MIKIPDLLIAILSTGIVASIITSLLNNLLQSRQSHKSWQREKLYDLHFQAHTHLVELIKATAISASGGEVSAAFHASVASIARLSLAYSGEQLNKLSEIETSIRSVYRGGLIQKSDIQLLESQLPMLHCLAYKDKRIKNLFRV